MVLSLQNLQTKQKANLTLKHLSHTAFSAYCSQLTLYLVQLSVQNPPVNDILPLKDSSTNSPKNCSPLSLQSDPCPLVYWYCWLFCVKSTLWIVYKGCVLKSLFWNWLLMFNAVEFCHAKIVKQNLSLNTIKQQEEFQFWHIFVRGRCKRPQTKMGLTYKFWQSPHFHYPYYNMFSKLFGAQMN